MDVVRANAPKPSFQVTTRLRPASLALYMARSAAFNRLSGLSPGETIWVATPRDKVIKGPAEERGWGSAKAAIRL